MWRKSFGASREDPAFGEVLSARDAFHPFRRRNRVAFPVGGRAQIDPLAGTDRDVRFHGGAGARLCLRLEKRGFGMGEVKLEKFNFLTTTLNDAIGWARKYSIFQYPFITACCGMEYMSTSCSHYDVDRFGAGFPRFSPRQSDVLFVVGTISHKMGPVLKKIYDQMCEPKWVVAFGVCTCTGGFYDNYATVMGIDTIITVA